MFKTSVSDLAGIVLMKACYVGRFNKELTL